MENEHEKQTRRTNSKTHGCLEGTLKIDGNLPKNISKGFITPNGSYKALIRFANGNLGVQPDIIPDGRSVSIKLKDVSGKRVINKNKVGDVDLHLVSANIFFCNDPQEMIDLFLFNENKKKWLFKNLFQFRRISSIFKNVEVIKNKSIIITNPLEIPYFTPVPFKLGDNQEVKYIIKPCTDNNQYEIPANPSSMPRSPAFLDRSPDKRLPCQIQRDLRTYPVIVGNILRLLRKSDNRLIPFVHGVHVTG